MSPAMTRIAAGCLTIIATVGILQNINGFLAARASADPLAGNDKRFAALRKSLPSRGFIGYVSDLEPAGEAGNRARLRAQYALIPLVIVPPMPFPENLLDPALQSDARDSMPQFAPGSVPDPLWFAGDFRDPGAGRAIADREKLSIVRDFGNGVMLLSRPSP